MRTPSSENSSSDSLIQFGWTERVAALFKSFENPSRYPGRVLRTDRGSCQVATPLGTVTAALARGKPPAGSELGSPTTGDWVVVRPDQHQGQLVEAILPRWSVIRRSDPSTSGFQLLAANVDRVFVVHGLDRPPQPGRIERSLVLAWESGAQPAVVLTKTDILSAGEVAKTVADLESLAPGVPIVAVSNESGFGFDALAPLHGPEVTVALIGASGTGKSSLVNRLVGTDIQPTGDTRRGDGKGRHTTTTRDLIPLPSGGVLIDTPGLREIGLWESTGGIEAAFDDITTLAQSCRFRDCLHLAEPGCAVNEAIAAGLLDERRRASFRTLKGEVAETTARQAQPKPGSGRRPSQPPPPDDPDHDW